MEAYALAATILVVDDDALIGIGTVDMLCDLGHTARDVSSGQAALDILASGERVDALITDFAMPGMTGVELADKARLLRPGLPILLATGYDELPNGAVSDLPRLGKPFLQSELIEKLSQVLARA
ncbi:hypothetical protein WH87_10030 [Devosia epidermidihirudinis]|uniref:Response regulatory domain-containing protein n=1 Tax=Devosia epidermidihirudinis TaxID=1293439 RepID=A0A0F5QB77_9HYPH|nr:response regulator [Devosia epidermidihirudinis]KKC37976.1 hypothetical protein WH87_10030 [Devosia epidermidihirudinis]